MRERSYYKSRAKAAFKRNYWICVLATVIIVLVSGGFSGRGNSQSQYTQSTTTNEEGQTIALDDYFTSSGNTITDTVSDQVTNNITSYFVPIPGLSTIVKYFTLPVIICATFGLTILSVFVFEVICVGGKKFFIENSKEKAKLGLLLSSFSNGHYFSTVKTMFFMNVKTILWTLLLIVPGIVKSYEYRMIPFLIADHPEMDTKEAFQVSREMMKGNKFDAFILDLSFFGWYILNTLTLGILSVFWTSPYVKATEAELYIDLRDKYYGAPEVSYDPSEGVYTAQPVSSETGSDWIDTNY